MTYGYEAAVLAKDFMSNSEPFRFTTATGRTILHGYHTVLQLTEKTDDTTELVIERPGRNFEPGPLRSDDRFTLVVEGNIETIHVQLTARADKAREQLKKAHEAQRAQWEADEDALGGVLGRRGRRGWPRGAGPPGRWVPAEPDDGVLNLAPDDDPDPEDEPPTQ